MVDEFLKMNGKDSDLIDSGRDKLLGTLERFAKVYGFRTNIISCSEFMKSEEYVTIFQETKEKVHDLRLTLL